MKGTRILGTYRVEYSNGMTQEKDLVSQQDFDTIINPKQQEIHQLEIDALNAKKDKQKADFLRKKAISIKQDLNEMFGDSWFTDNSPMYHAIATGKLILPEHQGGIHDVKIIRLIIFFNS